MDFRFIDEYYDDNIDVLKEAKLEEKAEWLACPNCGSNNTFRVTAFKEMEPFKDFEAIEDTEDTTFEKGIKEQDINKYQCQDCGCEFTKTDVDLKYSKTKTDTELEEDIDYIGKVNAEKELQRVYNNDFAEVQRLAKVIGIDSASGLASFMNREALEDEEPLDTLRRYIASTFTESLKLNSASSDLNMIAKQIDRELTKEDIDVTIITDDRFAGELIFLCLDVDKIDEIKEVIEKAKAAIGIESKECEIIPVKDGKAILIVYRNISHIGSSEAELVEELKQGASSKDLDDDLAYRPGWSIEYIGKETFYYTDEDLANKAFNSIDTLDDDCGGVTLWKLGLTKDTDEEIKSKLPENFEE